MEEVLVKDVCKKLLENPIIIERAEEFKMALGIEERLPILSMFKRGAIHSEELFNQLLSYWVFQKGSEATTGKLIEILRQMQNVGLAETLEQSFPNARIVDFVRRGKAYEPAYLMSIAASGSHFENRMASATSGDDGNKSHQKLDHLQLQDRGTMNQIAEIMGRDESLISRWECLSDDLDIQPEEMNMAKRNFQVNTLGANQLFLRILQRWVVRDRKNTATVGNLCKILRKHQFYFVTDIIESKLGHK